MKFAIGEMVTVNWSGHSYRVTIIDHLTAPWGLHKNHYKLAWSHCVTNNDACWWSESHLQKVSPLVLLAEACEE